MAISFLSNKAWDSWIFLKRMKYGDGDSAAAVVVVTVLVTFTCLLLRRSKKARLPPGPRGLPIVGYLPFLGSNLHRQFVEMAETYGPIYKLSLGQRLSVVISSPDLVKQIVRDQDIIFANRNPSTAAKVFSYGGKDIAFSNYNPDWRLLRKTFVREMQSGQNLDAFYSLRRNKVIKCVEELKGKIGEAIDIGELAFFTVIEMITSMSWGCTIEGDGEVNIGAEFREAVCELVETLGKSNLSDFFPVLARFDPQGVERKMKEVLQRIEKIYDHVIDECSKKLGKQERKDFMHFLLEYKDEDSGKSISKDQIKALLMNIVVGGSDTTARTMEWVMTEMMLHPHMMKKAQGEIQDVVGIGKQVEESHIKQLPYLQAIFKETLRLHPTAPLLVPHCPTETCTVGGYTIPKGTTVFLNAYALHRDPKFWENPLDFDPERFIGGERKLDYNGNDLHYVPFGSGRRICAGLPLAERMAMYVVATVLHAFDWELPRDAKLDTSEKFGIVLQKCTPLIAIPTPRF